MEHSCSPVLGRQEDCNLGQVGLVGLCFRTKTNLVIRSVSPVECHQYLEILCSRLRNTCINASQKRSVLLLPGSES